MERPRLAVFKLASCDGCQLTLLDCEDELLAVTEAVTLAHFGEASSRLAPGPYDVALVEGSVTTAHDAEQVQKIRAESKKLIAIGACATAGGIQALRNFRDHEQLLRMVYARPRFIDALATVTPVSAHVPVDYELHGCPVDKRQLLEVLSALLAGRKPAIRSHAVCMECKAQGNVCVMVARGLPCLGPVTHAGCGALCPAFARGCFGCFGPSDAAQPKALADELARRGVAREEVRRLFAQFTSAAEPFRKEAERP